MLAPLIIRSAWLMAVSYAAPFSKRRVEMDLDEAAQAPPPTVCIDSVRVDCDALDVLGRLLGLRQGHGQDTVAEIRLRLVGLDVVQWDLPLERAVIALGNEFCFIAALNLLLAANGQNAIGDLHLDVFLAQDRQLGRYRHGLIGFAEFEFRPTELAFH